MLCFEKMNKGRVKKKIGEFSTNNPQPPHPPPNVEKNELQDMKRSVYNLGPLTLV